MPSTTRSTLRQYWVATRAMIVLTAALGVVYPLAMTGVGLLTMPWQANGSKVTDAGTTVGSALIGQAFTGAKGQPLTQWFQTRPSAATNGSRDGYDANGSSGSNLGPNNPQLVAAIRARQKVIENTYGVSAARIPADAVTASGSGLDPDISVAYAELQVRVVSRTRGISEASVQKLVTRYTHGRDLGYLGEPYVNAVQLNLALSKMDPAGNAGSE